MDLTPAVLVKHGYVPSPGRGDKVPQLRAMSTNDCPNIDPRYLTLPPPACMPDGLTTWGYCGGCWTGGYVPARWTARVEAEIERLRQEMLR